MELRPPHPVPHVQGNTRPRSRWDDRSVGLRGKRKIGGRGAAAILRSQVAPCYIRAEGNHGVGAGVLRIP